MDYYQEILRVLAAETGMTESEICQTIQKTIDVFWGDPSPEAKLERESLGLEDDPPTPEEILTRVYLFVADSRNEETLC